MGVINGKSVLAVIPARGGSKRVPRKNLREFRGFTLLQWAWDAGRGSKYIDTLVVSTEDAEIARHAVNVLPRPAELATDEASSEEVMRHALRCYPHDWIVLLQPTSPLRTAADIDACIERAQMGAGCISVNEEGNRNGAVYVCTAEYLAAHDFSYGALMKYRMPNERSLDIDVEEDFAE